MKGDYILIAGGWSAQRYQLDKQDLRDRGTVVGINESAVLTRVTFALTMDRLWLEKRIETLDFLGVPVWYRQCTAKNVDPRKYNMIGFKGDVKSPGLSRDQHILFGSNSGVCAINLAFQHEAKRIFLIGYDMQKGPKGQAHWHPDYAWRPGGATTSGKFNQWQKEFSAIARDLKAAGIEVYNVSEHSALKEFPKIKWEQFLEMTK